MQLHSYTAASSTVFALFTRHYSGPFLIDNKPEGIIIVPQEREEDMTAVSVLERCAAGERRQFAEGEDNEAGELW